MSTMLKELRRISIPLLFLFALQAARASQRQPVNPEDGVWSIEVDVPSNRHAGLTVYVQSYGHGGPEMRPLFAFVTLYRGAAKAFETPPIRVMAAFFSIPLSGLKPGRYTCEVSVIDPDNGLVGLWQTPVSLL